MNNQVTLRKLIKEGSYLGFCEEKGYMYSIFAGYGEDYFKGNHKHYAVYCFKDGVIEHLITFPSYIKEEE